MVKFSEYNIFQRILGNIIISGILTIGFILLEIILTHFLNIEPQLHLAGIVFTSYFLILTVFVEKRVKKEKKENEQINK